MATVTIEVFGQQLETALGQLGISTRLLQCKDTPQQYCFDFAGGGYRTATLKSAMDFLNNRNGLTYEKNPNGGFTVMKRKTERTFISCADTANSIKEAVSANLNGEQKCYLCFGKGADGYITTNFDECRSILVAGTVGSGKSCLLNSLIMQMLLYSNANLILIDPKGGAEFDLYNDDVHNRIEHVAEDAQDSIKWLKIAVDIMEQRCAEMSRRRIKKYDGNRIIVVIDELADLMMASGSEVEDYIVRIAQKGRAAGVHLIVATQNPLVKYVTGAIKSNLPTRVCLKTADSRHSMNVIDCGKGAELLDKGDGLVKLPSSPDLMRCQSPYISDEQILKLITKRTV